MPFAMQRVEPPQEVVSSVLSFYSSQLTSHASLMVGLVVALFTLIQARQFLAEWAFQFGAVLIISGIVYSMFRVSLYGSLSGVLTHCAVDDYGAFLTNQKVRLFEHALVDGFAATQMLKDTTVRSLLYTRRGHESKRTGKRFTFWVQPPMVFSVVVAVLVVGAMLGWSVYTFVDAFGLLFLIVILLVVFSVRFAGSFRKAVRRVVSLSRVVLGVID